MMKNFLLWITILSSFTPGFADCEGGAESKGFVFTNGASSPGPGTAPGSATMFKSTAPLPAPVGTVENVEKRDVEVAPTQVPAPVAPATRVEKPDVRSHQLG